MHVRGHRCLHRVCEPVALELTRPRTRPNCRSALAGRHALGQARRVVRSLTVALVAFAALGACGSSNKGATRVRSTTTTSPPASTRVYCQRAKDYLATANVDTGSPQSTIAGFAKAAAAARRVAEVAPAEVRQTHDRLASAAAYLVAELQKRAPRTQQELVRVGRQLTAAMTTRYGDLHRETNTVQAFLARTCGIAH